MPARRVDLVDDLRAMGVRPGTCVMVHASVRAVGPVYGGPDEIHRAIEEAVSPGGAVMMYLGCPEGIDDVGRGIFSPEEEALLRANTPPWDPLTARAARDHGILAEFFRTWPGTVVSTHPTRFGARGDRAERLVAGQPWNYALGAGSPLERLCHASGKVLLLGSDRDQVTLLHYAEHVGDIPDRIVTSFEVPTISDGQRFRMRCLEVDSNKAHASWPDRFFGTIVDRFIREVPWPGAWTGRVGAAESVLLDARALIEFAVPIMEARARSTPSPIVPAQAGTHPTSQES